MLRIELETTNEAFVSSDNTEAERRPLAVRSSAWFADARSGPEPCFSSGNTGVEKNLLAGLAFHPMIGILGA